MSKYEVMDREYETMINFYAVFVAKIGGGTLGKAYEGDWQVTVSSGEVYLLDNDIITTGTPKTHAEVARLAMAFVDKEAY